MNELYLYIRIVLYLLSSVLLVQLGVIIRRGSYAFYVVAAQFILRGALLLFQVSLPAIYQDLNNYVSTPFIFFMLLVIVFELYRNRKY